MFCDPIIADITQQIGILSCGASKETIAELGTLYWFTLEFGAYYEEGKKMKAVGAGIMSSFGECKHFMSKEAKFLKLIPEIDSKIAYPI